MLINLIGSGSDFTCRFREVINIEPGSSVALKNITYEINTSNTITIDDTNNEFGVQVSKSSSWLTAIIPPGTYSVSSLVDAVENAMIAVLNYAVNVCKRFAWQLTLDAQNQLNISYDRVVNNTADPLMNLSTEMSYTSNILTYTGTDATKGDGFAMTQDKIGQCASLSFTLDFTGSPSSGVYYFGITDLSTIAGLTNFNPLTQFVYGIEIVNTGAEFEMSFLESGAYALQATFTNNVADTVNLKLYISDGEISVSGVDEDSEVTYTTYDFTKSSNHIVFMPFDNSAKANTIILDPLPPEFTGTAALATGGTLSTGTNLGATASVVSLDFFSTPVYQLCGTALGFNEQIYTMPSQKAGTFMADGPPQDLITSIGFAIESSSFPIRSYFSNANAAVTGLMKPILTFVPATQYSNNTQIIYEPKHMEFCEINNDETLKLSEIRIRLLDTEDMQTPVSSIGDVSINLVIN